MFCRWREKSARVYNNNIPILNTYFIFLRDRLQRFLYIIFPLYNNTIGMCLIYNNNNAYYHDALCLFYNFFFFFAPSTFCWREPTVLITKIAQRIACHFWNYIIIIYTYRRGCTLYTIYVCARQIKIITRNCNLIAAIRICHTFVYVFGDGFNNNDSRVILLCAPRDCWNNIASRTKLNEKYLQII